MTDDDWQGLLRAKGYRLTPQRELVLRAVERLGHATPDEVLKEVHAESAAVNISTVYRNLELLEDVGLVSHAHLSHGAPTYHSTTEPQHVHLICRSCSKVIEVEPATVAPAIDQLRDDHGFVADVGHLTIFGACEECSA